jgi:hypothetical protein
LLEKEKMSNLRKNRRKEKRKKKINGTRKIRMTKPVEENLLFGNTQIHSVKEKNHLKAWLHMKRVLLERSVERKLLIRENMAYHTIRK